MEIEDYFPVWLATVRRSGAPPVFISNVGKISSLICFTNTTQQGNWNMLSPSTELEDEVKISFSLGPDETTIEIEDEEVFSTGV